MRKDLKDEIGAKNWQAKHEQRLNHKHDKRSEEQNMSNPFSFFLGRRNMNKESEGMSQEQKDRTIATSPRDET